MNKVCSKFIQRNIFLYSGIIRTIQIIKISKEYINKLSLKKEINMINFCKIYYENDNKKPSLYILLRHFKLILPKSNFIQIYTYYMNNYIKKNPDDFIELELLLDSDIVETIIKQNLLNTNKISLIITSLNLAFNKNFNFINEKNISQIYFHFNCLDKEKGSIDYNYDFNRINFDSFLLFYLLVLKYFSNLIPDNIKKIGIINMFPDDINQGKIEQILKRLNFDKNLDINDDKIKLNLIFNELEKYKNIKSFNFNFINLENISAFLANDNHNFITNLDEIIIDCYMYKENEIVLFKKLINNEKLRNKLNINLTIHQDKFDEIKYAFDIVKFKDVSIDKPYDAKYKDKKIKINFPHNLKMLNYSSQLFDFTIFKQLTNIEILYIHLTSINSDYSLFKHLTNLKKLSINRLYMKNDDEFNNLIKTFNKYNQNLTSIEIDNFNIDTLLYGDAVTLSTPLELKNLKKFIFRCSELLEGRPGLNFENNEVLSYIDYYKINTFNIDKCEQLEDIRVPYYFECNNIKVLNNLKKISIDLFETNNIQFLKLILNCINLRELFISFLLPFHSYDIINYLYENIGKIRTIECEIHFNIIEKNFVKENSIINVTNLKNIEIEYINKINNIINDKKRQKNFIENLFVLPNNEDYENFRKKKYNEKIQILKNLPIIEYYGLISLEGQYLCDMIDLQNEKKLLNDYFGITL